MKIIMNDGFEIDFDKIESIEIKENEVIALKVQKDKRLTSRAMQGLIEAMKKVFPNNKVIILEEGMEIEIYKSKTGDGS